jgi:hypothetical protein
MIEVGRWLGGKVVLWQNGDPPTVYRRGILLLVMESFSHLAT